MLQVFCYIFLAIQVLLAAFVVRFKLFVYSKRLENKRKIRARKKAEKAMDDEKRKKKTFLQMFQISPTLFGPAKNKISPSVSKTSLNGETDTAKEEDHLCVVCFDEKHNTVIDPCGHGGVCSTCVKDLLAKRNSNCPLCRKPINLVIVYRKDAKGRFEQVDELAKDQGQLGIMKDNQNSPEPPYRPQTSLNAHLNMMEGQQGVTTNF